MAEETQAPAAPTAAAEVVVVEAEVAKPSPPAPEPEVEKKEEKKDEKEKEEATTEAAVVDVVESLEKDKETEIPQSASFKEETNIVADLIDPEKKALEELRELIVAALANIEFTKPPPPPVKEEKKKEEDMEEKEVAVEEGEKSEEPKNKKEEEGETKKEAEAEAPKKEDEPTKPEPCAPVKEEKPIPAAVKEEKKEIDDGAKTLEAIKETVVQVTAAAPPEMMVKEEEKKKPEEAEVVREEEKKKPEEAEVVAEQEEEKLPPPPPEEVFIWGLPLLGGEKSDTILLKFLRARDFKVKDALTMIKNTVIWRKEFGIEELLEQDLGVSELEKVVFMHGLDKEGHPVCYNVYGEFQEKELYQKAFGDEEKRKNFLRWRVQALEKGIRQKLDFSPEGVCTMVQVTDLKNSPGPWKKELRQATKQALDLLHDNYPEFAAKQV